MKMTLLDITKAEGGKKDKKKKKKEQREGKQASDSGGSFQLGP